MRSYRDIQSGGCIFRRCRREGAAELAGGGGARVGVRERERAERDILSLEFWLNNGARDVCACTSANAYARAVWTFGLDQRFSNCSHGKHHGEENFLCINKNIRLDPCTFTINRE